MIDPKEFYEAGLTLHGHKCPAMPMGLRVGAAAMNALGVERAKDGQLLALVELGEDHCATCFADGVQMITGCTFGKGNIKKLHYGKWGVTPRRGGHRPCGARHAHGSGHAREQADDFFKEYREKGVPASKVPLEVVQPLVDRVLSAPDEKLLSVGGLFTYEIPHKPHSFAGLVCDSCGEMVVEGYARLVADKRVCIPCQAKLTGAKE
jgi:formylmethanofuran dehydrogenase subunit E